VSEEAPEIPEELPSSPSRRRGRPPVIDEAHLLEVAREVFLARGIRATTLEVAERAGVSEGSLFHRFKSKEELFRRSMNLDPEKVALLFANALAAIEPLPIRQALEQLATRMLEIGRVAIPLMMMMWSNPQGCMGNASHTKPTPYRTLILGITGYLRSQMARGALRTLEPEIVARAFLGSIHHYSMIRTLSANDPNAPPQISEAPFVAGLVDLLLAGAAAPEDPPSTAKEPL
jgi:AcrR family transcriptional regulator